jgi:hypothetical protein
LENMRRPKLTLTLVGADRDQGTVRLGDFRKFCDSLTVSLRRVETKFPEGLTRSLRYRIVGLGLGSATLTVEPIPPRRGRDFGPDVIQLFAQTVSSLQSGTTVDPRLNNDDLLVFRRLAAPVTRGAKEIRIADTKVTSRFIANIDEVIGKAIPSEGAVKGRLERLNLHNRLEFVIYPPVPGYSIRCVFRDDLYDTICAAIRKTVTVYGTLHFRPEKPFPEWVQVSQIEIHRPDAQLPTLRELRGAWKGSTNGMKAVEFIQANRDE